MATATAILLLTQYLTILIMSEEARASESKLVLAFLLPHATHQWTMVHHVFCIFNALFVDGIIWTFAKPKAWNHPYPGSN